ncbi:MAG: WG repeat-containing protein [Bacteroides sp.]|nr:WG repeat-containing protein [Bacteroides sp.]
MRKSLYYSLLLCLMTSCNNYNKSEVNTELTPVASGTKFGYVDTQGQYQINPQFEGACFFHEGLGLAGSTNKIGFIDTKGNFVINPMYSQATTFSEGLAWVVKKEGAPTAINRNGEEQFTIKEAEMAYNYSEGLARYRISNSYGQTFYGFVDRKGSIVIPATEYTDAGDFKEGLAPVQNFNGDYGYINKDGELVINYQFGKAKSFIDGRAIVANENNVYGVINKKGKYIINPQFDYMRADKDSYIVRTQGSRLLGRCDTKGKIIINPQFDNVSTFGDNDLAPVIIDSKGGYINKKGQFIINPQFDDCWIFWDDYAIVKSNGKYGFINKEGKYIVNPQFDDICIMEISSVTSDYFNVEAITSAISKLISKNKLDEKIDFNTSLSNIIQESSLDKSTFKKHHNFEDIKKIDASQDATISLSIGGNFYEKVSDGWWGYNDVLAPNALPTKFQIIIKLKDKGYGKEEKVMMEILKSFEAKGQNIKELDYGTFHMAFSTERNKVIITITSTDSFAAFFGNSTTGNMNIPTDQFIAEAPETVSIEDQFRLTYTIGSQNTQDFKGPSITNFDVLVGPTRSQASSTTILNGKTTTKKSITFTYILMAHNAGTFTIPEATIKADGKSYTSNSVTINVTNI